MSMGQAYITADLEFYEVLNEFPIVEEILSRLDVKLSNVIEGESVTDFFSKCGFNGEEFDWMLKKLNSEVTYFLKFGAIPEAKPLQREVDVLDVEMIHH